MTQTAQTTQTPAPEVPTAPAVPANPRVSAANPYGRSRQTLERALKRAAAHAGVTGWREVPDDLNTAEKPVGLRELPTGAALKAAYLDTFPAGANPDEYVGMKDRIWYAVTTKRVKAGESLDDAAKARYERIATLLKPEEEEKAARRKAREAAGPSKAELKRRDETIAALRAAKVNLGQIKHVCKVNDWPVPDDLK